MPTYISCVHIVAAIVFLTSSGSCKAQAVDAKSGAKSRPAVKAEWQDLANEPSRADLFAIVAKKRMKELETSNPEGRVLPAGPFKIPTDALFDSKLNVPRLNSIFGIDISHYTDRSLQFDKLWGQEVRFVYAKATQGIGFRDPKFAYHWAKIASLPNGQRPYRGAYHFLSASGDGAAQAESFLKLVRQSGGFDKEDMPPVVDLEWDKASKTGPDRWNKKQPAEIMSTLLAWLNRVKDETGRVPMIYTNIQWWRERMRDEKLFDQLKPYKVWIADYSQSSRGSESPRVPNSASWHIWQFGESAVMPAAYQGALDINIFKGTYPEFHMEFSVPPR